MYDDNDVILRPAAFDGADDLAAVFSADYYDRFGERTYRPVATLAYFLDHNLWSASPRGAHAFNAALHALAAAAVFYLLAAMGFSPVWAFAGAFLFGVHPVKTEAVALASNREELLCGLFFFAAFALHLRGGAGNRIAAFALFLLSLFSKEMAASFPAVLFAYHFFIEDRDKKLANLLKKHIPEYIPYAVGVLLLLGFRYVWMANPGGGAEYPGGGGWRAFALMSYVFARYLFLLAMPARLCADYVILADNNIVMAAGILFGVAASVFIAWAVLTRRRKSDRERDGTVAESAAGGMPGAMNAAGFAAAFFLLSLLPVSNIIPFGETMAERYLYIPSFAFAFAAAYVFRKMPGRQAAGVCAAAFGILFSILTPMRLAAWQDERAFWEDTVSCAPRSAEAHMNLANAYLKDGDVQAAMEHYALVPECEQTGDEFKYRYNLGLAYRALGETGKAKESFLDAVELKPDFVDPMYHLADIHAAEGRYEKGLEYIEKAIAADPGDAKSYYIGGQYIIRNSEGAEDLRRAVVWLEKAVELVPRSAVNHGALGQAYLRAGNLQRAEAELLVSIELDPASTAAYHLLHSIYSRTGRTSEAVRIYEQMRKSGAADRR